MHPVREPYLALTPMPAERIIPGARVYVPVWDHGKVTGWDYAEVLEVNDSGDGPVYLARLESPQPRTQEQIYYGWSVECAACRDQPRTATCHQCNP